MLIPSQNAASMRGIVAEVAGVSRAVAKGGDASEKASQDLLSIRSNTGVPMASTEVGALASSDAAADSGGDGRQAWTQTRNSKSDSDKDQQDATGDSTADESEGIDLWI